MGFDFIVKIQCLEWEAGCRIRHGNKTCNINDNAMTVIRRVTVSRSRIFESVGCPMNHPTTTTERHLQLSGTEIFRFEDQRKCNHLLQFPKLFYKQVLQSLVNHNSKIVSMTTNSNLLMIMGNQVSELLISRNSIIIVSSYNRHSYMRRQSYCNFKCDVLDETWIKSHVNKTTNIISTHELILHGKLDCSMMFHNWKEDDTNEGHRHVQRIRRCLKRKWNS